MSQYLVDTLSTRNTRAKKPSPTHEWMVGYNRGNGYITDGSVLIEISVLDAIQLLPQEFQYAFTHAHNTDNPTDKTPQGVKYSFKGGPRDVMHHYPQAKQLMPLKTRPMEYTRMTLDGKLGAVRVIRNPETKEPTALNNDYIANLLWIGGYPRGKRNDDFRILQAEGNNEAPCIIEPINDCGIRFLIMPVQCREILADVRTAFVS